MVAHKWGCPVACLAVAAAPVYVNELTNDMRQMKSCRLTRFCHATPQVCHNFLRDVRSYYLREPFVAWERTVQRCSKISATVHLSLRYERVAQLQRLHQPLCITLRPSTTGGPVSAVALQDRQRPPIQTMKGWCDASFALSLPDSFRRSVALIDSALELVSQIASVQSPDSASAQSIFLLLRGDYTFDLIQSKFFV